MINVITAGLRKILSKQVASYIAIFGIVIGLASLLTFTRQEFVNNVKNANSSATINVEECLKRDNFSKQNGMIIQTLDSDGTVKQKMEHHPYGNSDKDSVYGLEIVIDAQESTTIHTSVKKEIYDKVNQLSRVHVTRQIFYTPSGVRLESEDTIYTEPFIKNP